MTLKPLVIILSIFSLVTACDTHTATNEKTDFNKDKWQAGDWLTKGKMVDNIASESILIGKTKNEVIELLGQPNDSTYTSDRYYWTIDRGLKTGPLGLGGTWLFKLNVNFDTIDYKVNEVWISD